MQRVWIIFVLIGAAAAGDVPLRTTPKRLVLASEALEVQVDRATGQLAEVAHRPSGTRLLSGLSPVDLRADGRWVAASDKAATRWRCVDHKVETTRDGQRLTTRSRAGEWEVASRLELNGNLLARSATFRYLGRGTPTVRGTRFWLEGAACGKPADSFYEILSRWPPEQFAMGKLEDGRQRRGTRSQAASAFVGMHNRPRQLSLLAAFYSETEWADLAVWERKGAVDVAHDHRVLDRPKPAQAVPTGTQYLLVVEGAWSRALAACQGLYERIGVRVPEAVAERGARSVIYSCHPGGTIDSGFRDVGHVRRLQTYLPRLQQLGVNVVWLLPFWHGRVYAPVDYDRLQRNWADEASLRQFTQEAHRRGMRVLLDLIPHGPRPESGLHERHRDWVSTTEDGQMLLWWGCLGCDYAHPGWQRFMATHAADWVRRCDIDGYRVDCAGGGPPNWAAAGGRRPSMSGLCGAMGILRQARAAMEKVKKPIVLLAEAEGVPLNTVCEYTYPWTWAFHVLPALREMPAEEWVPKAIRWLQNRKSTLPRGSNAIWFLENHDTPRAEMVWGPKAQRALLAFCAFARGAPFLYQEQQVGYTPFLRTLYAIRRSLPALTIGKADYLPVADDPRVLTIRRCHGDQEALVLINFSDKAARTRLRTAKVEGIVRRDLADDPTRRFALGAPIALEPGGYAVLVPEEGRPTSGQESVLEHRPAAREALEATTDAKDAFYILQSGPARLLLNGLRGGLVHSLHFAGREGSWVAGHDVIEGPRKFSLGRPAFRLSEPARKSWALMNTYISEAGACITARAGEDLHIDLHTTLHGGNRATINMRLLPKAHFARTRAALTTVLRFPLAAAWAVETAEGLLHGEHTLWRFDDVPRKSRYWHDTTGLYWESRLQPLHPDLAGPAIFVIDTRRGEHLRIQVFASHPDLLQNIVLKERDGDHKQLTLRVEWLRGDRSVTLRKGETYDLSLRLSCGLGRPWQATPNYSRRIKGPRLAASRGNYTIANDHYRIVLGRSLGGNIRSLQLKDRDEPIISHSTIYTDYGLYPPWKDPLGREHGTSAHNRGDFEPDVELRRDGERLHVGFTGYFRHPGHGGRSILSPRCQYRLRYTFDRSDTIRVEAAVRPHMTVGQAKAFLAYTLHLPGARRWTVAGADGGFRGSLERAKERQWQSAVHPLRSPVLAVETAGGSALFSDIAPADALQNVFLHAGKPHATAFFAWLDGRPADVQPQWRTVTYKLKVSHWRLGGLLKDLKALRTWPPAHEKQQ